MPRMSAMREANVAFSLYDELQVWAEDVHGRKGRKAALRGTSHKRILFSGC